MSLHIALVEVFYVVIVIREFVVSKSTLLLPAYQI
jgi:hypothetical protein